MKINRRRILSMLGMSPALLAGATAEARTPAAAGKAAEARTPAGAANVEAGGAKLVAFNPKGTPPSIQLIPMAPRPSTLDGKTVYLVDTGFEGGGLLLQQIQLWFGRNMPSVTTVFKRKAGPYAEDDPKLWAEIKEKGNAAIMAI
ncbi:MAG: hypothetical protein WB460_05480, partial [Candidatus Acidiferrales bacterium]